MMAIIAPASAQRSTGSDPAIRIRPITICSKVTFYLLGIRQSCQQWLNGNYNHFDPSGYCQISMAFVMIMVLMNTKNLTIYERNNEISTSW